MYVCLCEISLHTYRLQHTHTHKYIRQNKTLRGQKNALVLTSRLKHTYFFPWFSVCIFVYMYVCVCVGSVCVKTTLPRKVHTLIHIDSNTHIFFLRFLLVCIHVWVRVVFTHIDSQHAHTHKYVHHKKKKTLGVTISPCELVFNFSVCALDAYEFQYGFFFLKFLKSQLYIVEALAV